MSYCFSSQIQCGWQRSCFHHPQRIDKVGGGETLKNFEQWAQDLSKQIFVRNEEEDIKIFWKMNEAFDDDFEEEE